MTPFNLSGLALPCGFTSGGLPISLQLAGRPFDEATVLRAGHALRAGHGVAHPSGFLGVRKPADAAGRGLPGASGGARPR